MRSTLLASMLLRRSPIRLASAERCSTKWRNEGRRTTSSSGPSSANDLLLWSIFGVMYLTSDLGRSMRLLGYAPPSWRHQNKQNKATRKNTQPSRQLKNNLNWISWFFVVSIFFWFSSIYFEVHQVQFNRVLFPAGGWCTCVHTISSLVVLVISIPYHVCFFQFRYLFSSGSVFLLS